MEKRTFATLWLAVITTMTGGVVPPVMVEGSALCDTTSIGIPVNNANSTYGGAFFGRSVAQVFDAPHSHISAVTVWRQPDPNANLVPMQLFIGAVSAGDSLRPDPLSLLLTGPIAVLYGASVTPRPVRFVVDPPLILPSAGKYFFAIKDELCIAAFVLLSDSTGSYKEGGMWQITPSPGCEGLGNNSNVQSGQDLIFVIEYCDPFVGVETRSWGDLKSRYR